MADADGVIVVGGGVIGLTTAVVLAERGRPVRVWSRDPLDGCTSAVAGGLCWPYAIEPMEQALAWAEKSFRHFAWLAERSRTTGVRLVRGRVAPGAAEAGAPAQWLSLTGSPPRAPLIDMPHYLRHLHDRLTAAGGRFEQREAASLEEASSQAGAVFHCTGLGARTLVGDTRVRPLRGQLVVVENPGVTEWYVGADGPDGTATYLFPQPYGLLLGGTAQPDSWDTDPDPAVAEAIVARCAEVRPEVAGARVREHRVGLRPVRDGVRLELERLPDGTPCVHNYGHGGGGVTVSWGAALDGIGLLDAVEEDAHRG